MSYFQLCSGWKQKQPLCMWICLCAPTARHTCFCNVFQSFILLAMPVSSLSARCFLPPALAPLPAAETPPSWDGGGGGGSSLQKMSERSHVNKRADSPVSFLCEVIMHSPRCFCSHANEVDCVGNHFQTLSWGESRNRKTKAGTKERFAAVAVCAQKWR